MNNSKNARNFYYRRKNGGLCIERGKPTDGNGVRCKECAEAHSKYKREQRRWYQSHGICPRCGKNDLVGDEKKCLECAAKGYESVMASRARLGKESYNKGHAEWEKEARKKALENGICPICRKREVTPGYKSCAICREKGNARKRILYKPRGRENWIENGLCRSCGKPVKEGYKLCEEHYQKILSATHCEKAVEARKELAEKRKHW